MIRSKRLLYATMAAKADLLEETGPAAKIASSRIFKDLRSSTGFTSAGVKKTSAGVKFSEIFDLTQGQNLRFSICK